MIDKNTLWFIGWLAMGIMGYLLIRWEDDEELKINDFLMSMILSWLGWILLLISLLIYANNRVGHKSVFKNIKDTWDRPLLSKKEKDCVEEYRVFLKNFRKMDISNREALSNILKNPNLGKKRERDLAQINWTLCGGGGDKEEFFDLKNEISNMCKGNKNANYLINDIVLTFKKYGYVVVKA